MASSKNDESASQETDYHIRLGAWFLGPKAENLDVYRKFMTETLEQHSQWRRSYCPEDKASITDSIKAHPLYQLELNKIDKELKLLVKHLRNSMPFFSSRYKGHMCWDTSMVGSIGYFAAALWNPNNVATEGSPVTTALEIEVGKQLCGMLGYTIEPLPEYDRFKQVVSWGHITSCGSIANAESLWAARNIRFLPLALQEALANEEDLKEWIDTELMLADGNVKPISKIDDWEILNVPADNILSAYMQIADEKKIADEKNHVVGRGLEIYTAKYDISHLGMRIAKQGYYFVPATRHYSWDKAGALLGIGQANMFVVDVDCLGRMKVDSLRVALQKCLAKKMPVFSVVAVVGTTAEGAVDPVNEIWCLREEFRSEGLDFFLHADAAWGGYMCSILTSSSQSRSVPFLPLSKTVQERLEYLCRCDTVTLDPHKSGYIQYPAGALCYRNGKARFSLNFSAPYLFAGEGDPSVGLFGIEGSKPGAAVAATYLHNKVVGLNSRGHGRLLAQANFTTKILYCLMYTLASDEDPFRLATYQPLPKGVDVTVLKEILALANEDIRHSHMKILRELGPDMLINCIAVNFKWPLMGVGEFESDWNTSTVRANAVINKMLLDIGNNQAMTTSDVTSPWGVARKKLYMIRNTLLAPVQAEVANQLRERVGLEPAPNEPLNIMVSTNMDPWPTVTGFMDVFRHELRQSVLRSVGAANETPSLHGFVAVDAGSSQDEMDGKELFEVFGEYLPMFFVPERQYHIIIKASFESSDEKMKYLNMAADETINPTCQPLVFRNTERLRIEEILHSSDEIPMEIFIGLPENSNPQEPKGHATMTITDIVRYEHFEPFAKYPTDLEYLLYGNQHAAYLSHCPAQNPDYHHVVRVETFPQLSLRSFVEEEFSEMRLEHGVMVKIPLPPGKNNSSTSSPPLNAKQAYKFQYMGECGREKWSFLQVADNVWYDAAKINEEFCNDEEN